VGTIRLQRDLEPGTVYTAELTLEIPREFAGAYFVHVVADAENEVVDDRRANNTLALPAPLTITPRPAPDLEVTEVGVPAEAFSGQPATFTWTVRNRGGAEAVGEWFDRVYLSPDATFDADADLFLGYFTHSEPLAPGASHYALPGLHAPGGGVRLVLRVRRRRRGGTA
jgi:hypothetical protein